MTIVRSIIDLGRNLGVAVRLARSGMSADVGAAEGAGLHGGPGQPDRRPVPAGERCNGCGSPAVPRRSRLKAANGSRTRDLELGSSRSTSWLSPRGR